LPVMDEWHTRWSGRGGRVVAISIDKEVRKARRFVETANLSMTVLHDDPSGLAKTLDLPSLPCTYLLDRDGNVVTMIRGGKEKDLEVLHRKAETILAASQTEGSK
jgi:peroxiredoxin